MAKLETKYITGIGVFPFLLHPSKERITEEGETYKSQYTVNLIISAKEAKELNAQGVKVKTVPESFRGRGVDEYIGKNMVKCYRNITKTDGTVLPPLVVVDSKCNRVKTLGTIEGADVTIGNGSKLRIAYVLIKAQKSKVHGMNMNSVQILTLVPYIVNDIAKTTFTKVDGGFSLEDIAGTDDLDSIDSSNITVPDEEEDFESEKDANEIF